MAENNNTPQGFIPKHGGYRNLLSYQRAEIIYDGTVYFTKRFFRKHDRTIDQMVQAARNQVRNDESFTRHSELVSESPANNALNKEIAGQARNDERIFRKRRITRKNDKSKN